MGGKTSKFRKNGLNTFILFHYFRRFLDMHMYVTSALQRTDMKAVGLQLALDLLHEKVKIVFLDFVCGLSKFLETFRAGVHFDPDVFMVVPLKTI